MTGQQQSVQIHDGEGVHTMHRTSDAIFSPVVVAVHALRRKFVNGITQPQETLDNAPQVHAPYRNATQELASYCEPALKRSPGLHWRHNALLVPQGEVLKNRETRPYFSRTRMREKEGGKIV